MRAYSLARFSRSRSARYQDRGSTSLMPSASAPTGSWVLKPGGALFWSPEMFQIFGYKAKRGSLSYQDVIDRIHPADAAQVDQLVQTAFVLHKRLEGECRVVLRHGLIRHIRYLGHPVPTEEGTVDFVGIIMDISEQRTDHTA